MEIIATLAIFILIILLFRTKSKIEFLSQRNKSKMIEAEVVEYRKEKVPFRNNFARIDYPFVKILTSEIGDGRIYKLRYADSWNRTFKIGEHIQVFWLNGELMYWNAMDKGIDRILPQKWPW